MLGKQFADLLNTEHIPYLLITHNKAYTAREIAAQSHIPPQELAKCVIVKLDDELVMVVVPASHHVNIAALASATGAGTARLAHEADFKRRFPDCEVGAMPPFGNLYKMPVIVDESLTKDKEIAFNCGSHEELVRISYEDFAKMVRPRMLRFAAEGGQAFAFDDRLW
jgi:Ala-tRNA(Pro) deacylase